MDKNKIILLNKALELIQDDIKIGQKDIAIEKGVSLRAVRKMKSDNPALYDLFEKALKFSMITGELDMRFKTEFGDDNIYWLWLKDKKIIGFDEKWLRTSKLDDREIKNLRDEEIGETTIRDKEFKSELTEKYCGEILTL